MALLVAGQSISQGNVIKKNPQAAYILEVVFLEAGISSQLPVAML